MLINMNKIPILRSPLWRDTLYWLVRGKVTSQAKMAFILTVFVALAVAMKFVSETTDGFLLVAIILGFAGVLFWSDNNARHLRKRFFDAKPLAFRHVATPISSIFNALAREGIPLSGVKSIQFETGNFSDLLNYLKEDGKELSQLFVENPEAHVAVYGKDDTHLNSVQKKDAIKYPANREIEFHDTGRRGVEHRSIIRTKGGRYLLWFEEHHEIIEGRHFYPYGAFLFEITEEASNQILDDVMAGRPTSPDAQRKAELAHA